MTGQQPGNSRRRYNRVAGIRRDKRHARGRSPSASSPPLRKLFVTLTPVLVALLIAWLTPVGPWLIAKIHPGPKITASIEFYRGTCDSFWVPSSSNASTSDPGFATPAWADSSEAAQALSFYPGRGMSMITFTVTGYDTRPVTVTALRFRVSTHRERPNDGTILSRECGDETVARYADVDLDVDPPRITQSSALPVSYGSDTRTTPLSFPYTVSNSDTESLLIVASTSRYVEWTAELAWSNGVDSGVLAIDNDGSPFRTTVPPGV